MSQPETGQPMGPQPATGNSIAAPVPVVSAAGSCPTCGTSGHAIIPATSSSYVYAIGSVEPRFPQLSVEKELAQVMRLADTTGLTDRQALRNVLQDRQNRYLVAQMCWVMSIGGIDSYILMPRDPLGLDLLVDTLRPQPSPVDLDVVVGHRGPVASPDLCNGLTIPILVFDVIYSFDRTSLIEAIPRPESIPSDDFAAAAGELFDRIIQITDNNGSADSHRAANYLLARYPAIYTKTAEEFAGNASLTSIEVKQSRLSGTRNIADVIFSYTNRSTDVVEKYFVRVDVTEEFPFLAAKLAPYFDKIL